MSCGDNGDGTATTREKVISFYLFFQFKVKLKFGASLFRDWHNNKKKRTQKKNSNETREWNATILNDLRWVWKFDTKTEKIEMVVFAIYRNHITLYPRRIKLVLSVLSARQG